MFTTALTPQVAQAVQMSACIENSGQCTALRHLVAPSCSNAWVEGEVLQGVRTISEPLESVRDSAFASLYQGGISSAAPKDGYVKHPSLPAYVSAPTTCCRPMGKSHAGSKPPLHLTGSLFPSLRAQGACTSFAYLSLAHNIPSCTPACKFDAESRTARFEMHVAISAKLERRNACRAHKPCKHHNHSFP
jgi:hypothetical protein